MDQGKTIWQEEWERFSKDCARAAEISHENLSRLMEDNKDTEYGRKYGFSRIRSVADYQRLVPISDYGDYEEGIKRMIGGEGQVLTSYEVKHFIMTSGSTGVQKQIPLTKEALRRCSDAIYYASYAGVPGIEDGRYLHMSVFRMEPPAPQLHTILSAAYFRGLHDRGGYGLKERYLGGERLLFTKGIGKVPYVKLWIALSSPDMAGIQAFFLYDILLFFKYFEENWEKVLEDVVTRRIPEDMPLSKEVREALLSLPALEEGWISQVRRECGKGFLGIIRRLWGQMKFVSGVGGSTFFAQEAALRRYLGGIPIHYFSYAASECMMAITTKLESTENVLIPRSGFFEFIPYGKDGQDGQVKTIEELEEGKQYEVVVTNFSGLYRYRLNDVVKVTGFYGQAPVLEVGFRKNQAVNIAGEKMDLQTIAGAVEELARRKGLTIFEYSIHDEKSLLPGRYQCFLETGENGQKKPEDQGTGQADTALGQEFDRILTELNGDYEDLRRLGLIGAPMVYRVAPGAHEECKKRFGTKQAQNKPLQYLANPSVIAFMRERIL